jgi:uncharacterized cupredoxin-like copper-binding protein
MPRMHDMRRAAAVAVALLLGACSSTATTSAVQSPDAGRTVRIEMSEFAYSPPRVILQAGETVTLVLANVGKLEHEFMAGTGVMAGMGYRTDWLAKAKAKGVDGGGGEHAGLMVRVPAGATARLVLLVPAQNGEIEFGCFVQGHYEGGMHGLIVVTGAARESTGPGASGGPGGAPTETADPEGMEAH